MSWSARIRTGRPAAVFVAPLRRLFATSRLGANAEREEPKRRHPGAGEIEASWPAEIEAFSPRLEARIDVLQPLAGALEEKFTAISVALEKLPGASRRLVKASETFLESASGRQCKDTLFPPILGLLEPALTFLRHCVPEVNALTGSLRDVAAQIGKVLAAEEQTYTKMTQLRFVRPMIRIEASRFDAATEESVLSLGSQIESFTKQLGEALCGKFGVLHDALRVIDEVGNGLAQNAQSIRTTVATQEARVQSLIASFREGLEVNANRDIGLTSVAAQVSALVGRMVVSLQAQDIVSQRLAHVNEGLEALRQALGGKAGGVALSLARVALAQLTSIGEELQKTEGDLRDSANRARDLLNGIERTCLDLPEFKVKTIGEDGVAVVVLGMVAAFQATVHDIAAQIRLWSAAIEPLGSYAADATTLMRDISAGIRIIALNSQITSSNIPGGRALDVLATHVGRVAMEATESAQHSALQSDEVVRCFGGIVKRFQDFEQTGSVVMAQLDAERDECLAPLRRLAEEALAGRGAVIEVIAEASELLGALERPIDLGGLRDSAIVPAEELLREIVSALEASPQAASVPGDADTENLLQSYTMASERQVHAAALGGVAAAAAAAPADDFELFSAPGAPAGGDVELF